MMVQQRSRWQFFTGLFVVLLTGLLAACGSASTSTSSAAAAAARTPTPATACLSVTTGTIQSLNTTSVHLTNVQGKEVQATLTSKTTFTRQATLTSTDLKTGMLVSVIVVQNADSSYSAQTVSVRSTLARQGGFASGAGLCSGQRRRGTGTPGAFGGPGFGSGTPGAGGAQSRQTINGTISQVSGSSLTVTDTSNDFAITLTATTRMTAQLTATASDLRIGEAITISGSANSQGVINASSVSILQGLPTRRATPAPTPTTTG
jgi:hypothetical protein